jgi:hypothetical protein
MCNNIWYQNLCCSHGRVQSSAKDIKISVSDFMWQVSLFLYGGPPTSNYLWSLFAILRLLFIHPSKLFVGHFWCPQLCGNPIIFLFSIRKLAALIASGAVSLCVCGGPSVVFYFVAADTHKGDMHQFCGTSISYWVNHQWHTNHIGYLQKLFAAIVHNGCWG